MKKYNFLINYSSEVTLEWFNELSHVLELPQSNDLSSPNSIFLLDSQTAINFDYNRPGSIFIVVVKKDDFMSMFNMNNQNISGYVIAGENFCNDAMKMIKIQLSEINFELLYKNAFKSKLTLSIQRMSTVSSLESYLIKKNINDRLKDVIITTFDELIMNAIYDAPIDLNQRHTLKSMGRDTILLLDKPIDVEILIEDGFVSFAITDYYGSFDADTFNSFISRHYMKDQYIPPVDSENKGGGLGLALSLQKGASLFLKSEQNKYTKIIAFFPIEESYKDFKKHSKAVINQLYKKVS